MNSRLIETKPGDQVWCGTDSGLAPASFEKVVDVGIRVGEDGSLVPAIYLNNDHVFCGTTGKALTPPYNYSIINFGYEMAR